LSLLSEDVGDLLSNLRNGFLDGFIKFLLEFLLEEFSLLLPVFPLAFSSFAVFLLLVVGGFRGGLFLLVLLFLFVDKKLFLVLNNLVVIGFLRFRCSNKDFDGFAAFKLFEEDGEIFFAVDTD